MSYASGIPDADYSEILEPIKQIILAMVSAQTEPLAVLQAINSARKSHQLDFGAGLGRELITWLRAEKSLDQTTTQELTAVVKVEMIMWLTDHLRNRDSEQVRQEFFSILTY